MAPVRLNHLKRVAEAIICEGDNIWSVDVTIERVPWRERRWYNGRPRWVLTWSGGWGDDLASMTDYWVSGSVYARTLDALILALGDRAAERRLRRLRRRDAEMEMRAERRGETHEPWLSDLWAEVAR